jgi:hypothetical protein
MSIGSKFVENLLGKGLTSIELPDQEILKIVLGGRTFKLRVMCVVLPFVVPFLVNKKNLFLPTLLWSILGCWIGGVIYTWRLVSSTTGEIIKKSIIEVPFAFSMQVDSKCSIEANLQKFNVTEWNKAVEHNEKLEKENTKLRNEYDKECSIIDREYQKVCRQIDNQHRNLLSQYEGNMARYSAAKQNYNQNMADPSMDAAEKGFLWGSTKLVEPTKPDSPDYPEKFDNPPTPLYNEIEDLKESDFCDPCGSKQFQYEIEKYTPEKNHTFFFSFINKESEFLSLMNFPCWSKEITGLVSSIYSHTGGIPWVSQPIVDYKISGESTKISIDNEKIEKFVKKWIFNNVFNLKMEQENLEENISIKNYSYDYSEFDNSFKVLNYIPLLAVDYKTRNGEEKVVLFDFITKEVIHD